MAALPNTSWPIPTMSDTCRPTWISPRSPPILCAGVTVYKGLKVTDTKPGDWVVISGIGGLGHMAVQYAKAMGLNVVAVDVDDAKLDLARRLGRVADRQRRATQIPSPS